MSKDFLDNLLQPGLVFRLTDSCGDTRDNRYGDGPTWYTVSVGPGHKPCPGRCGDSSEAVKTDGDSATPHDATICWCKSTHKR